VDLGLAGTVAIVGGSSSGMGRATARTLAGEGCRVVLFARRAELLSDVAAAITA
jgi:3-oxoacyl-[acyl-carrier protein] reductase